MLRGSVRIIPRTNTIFTRACNSKKKIIYGENVEDLLRVNSIIQHTKYDIADEVRASIKKEIDKDISKVKKELHDELLKFSNDNFFNVAMLQSVSIFYIHILLLIIY